MSSGKSGGWAGRLNNEPSAVAAESEQDHPNNSIESSFGFGPFC